MNTAQTLLTFGAFILLTTAILNFNRVIADSDISISQDRYRLEALSILNAYVEEASQKYFDEASLDTSTVKALTNFTLSASLGFELNDSNVIDDFDDYHNLTLVDTGRSSIPYRLSFTVDYVTLSGDSFITSAARQYHKRLTVSITDAMSDPFLYHYVGDQRVPDTLSISFVNSYWFYN